MSKPADDNTVSAFFHRLIGALSRIFGLAVLICCHWGLGKLLELTTRKEFGMEVLFLDAISFAIFALLYCYLLWEVLVVFIPKLKARQYPGTEEAE